DFVADHEVQVAAPVRVNLDQCRRYFHHAHARGHDRANADGEVDVAGPRHVGPGQHGLADLGALLGGQLHVAAALLLLGLARLLALLTLHRALVARRLLALGRALALLARRLAGGLVALPALLLGLLVLRLLILLGLLVLAALVLATLGRALLTLRGLAGG